MLELLTKSVNLPMWLSVDSKRERRAQFIVGPDRGNVNLKHSKARVCSVMNNYDELS